MTHYPVESPSQNTEEMTLNRLLLVPLMLFAVTACDRQVDETGPAVAGEPVAPRAPAIPAPALFDLAGPAMVAREAQVEADLHTHTARLASDVFEGRAPGTAGEERTVAYIAEQFSRLGLEPGNDGSWFQEVPITAVTSSHDAVLSLRGSGFSADLAYGDDMMAFTQRQREREEVNDSPLVFVGYGIVAPERDWNDYAGIDATGRTVVVLVNDPGFATQDPGLFNGNSMTYYGRWDYKYAEAARQGAEAVIIVHETDAAAYPWEVVRDTWSGANLGLTAENRHLDKVAVQAWIPRHRAEELFSAAGMDYAANKAAAARPGFRAVEMADLRASITLDNTLQNKTSRNVLGLIEGAGYPEEVVVYSSHWDHLGVRPQQSGDTIYNGASDNASGVAGLMALARLFAQQDPAPERSVLFLAVTAEEAGLLGSAWYADNPVFPMHATVANLNMDNIAKGSIGKTLDVAVVGFGNSELEDYLADAASGQERTVVQEPNPEKGYYYRSDHFNFARKGVPALYLTVSANSRDHGPEWGRQRLEGYIANHYHKPSDEYDPGWNLAGAAQDVMLLYAVGAKLAAGRDFPAWNEGVEFRQVRAASLAEAGDERL
jgi:Zn-dependent M28 family amino/carboxypeptidase